MARQSDDKAKNIKYAFPSDFIQLEFILETETEKSLLLKLKDEFHTKPEYDLPYKLLSKIYPDKCKINFRKLYREIKNTEDDELYYHTKTNFDWNDYMFQFPGIYDMFGIKRDFHIGALRESTDCKLTRCAS